MLYNLAHFLKAKIPFIWSFIEQINSILFYWRYKMRLKEVNDILSFHKGPYCVLEFVENDIQNLVDFFSRQSDDAFTYFRPHDFDKKTITRLVRNKAFLAYIVKENNVVIGYFFLRSFFWGKCYRGYIVDTQKRNKGISKTMAIISTEIASLLGMRSFGSISPENMASFNSSKAVNDVRIIETLKNGDYYVEYCKK